MRKCCYPGLLLCFAFLWACGTAGTVHNRYKFARRRQPLLLPSALRTDGIYVDSTTNFSTRSSMYQFLRFYTDGRCFVSTTFLGAPEHNRFYRTDSATGEQSFFRNTGNAITYEYWGGGYAGYCYCYCTVDDSGLHIDATKARGIAIPLSPAMPNRYHFVPLQLPDTSKW